jgi:hypothetical protein
MLSIEQPNGFESNSLSVEYGGFGQSHITYEQQLRDYAIANDFSYEHCYTDDGDWQFRYWMDGWSMAGIVDVLYFEIGCFMVLNAMRGICEGYMYNISAPVSGVLVMDRAE